MIEGGREEGKAGIGRPTQKEVSRMGEGACLVDGDRERRAAVAKVHGYIANLARQHPGRDRQSSQARAGINFSKQSCIQKNSDILDVIFTAIVIHNVRCRRDNPAPSVCAVVKRRYVYMYYSLYAIHLLVDTMGTFSRITFSRNGFIL